MLVFSCNFVSQLGLPRRVLIQFLKDTANQSAHPGSPSFRQLVPPASQAQVPQAKDPKRKVPSERSQAQDTKPKFPSESSQVKVPKLKSGGGKLYRSRSNSTMNISLLVHTIQQTST